MSVSFSDLWNTLLYNTEEDPNEAFVLVPQAENEQPVDDLNTSNSLVVEASHTETSTTEKGNIDKFDTSAETAASNLPDDSQIEAENEIIEYILVSKDASAFLTVHAADESSDSNNKTIVNEEELVSSSCPSSPAEDKLRKKIFLFDTAVSTIGLVIPVLAIGFGVGNIGNCPADFCISYLVLIIGIVSLFMVSYALLKSNRENFHYWTKLDEDVMFMAFYILSWLWLFKNGHFFSMDASFDSSAKNYCNHAFYIFNIFLDIFLAMGVIMGSCLFDLYHERRPSSPTRDEEDWMMFE